eukprot:scaffold4498_cov119-Isochrysis_galbana.AAC.47
MSGNAGVVRGGSVVVRGCGSRCAGMGGCRVLVSLVSCVCLMSIVRVPVGMPVCVRISNINLEWAKTIPLIASSARPALGLALALGSSDR